MNATTDQQLLREYATNRSEAAFSELVRRHVDLVHSAALRMVRNPHTAEDVAQGVFTALAKDARRLSKHPILVGWLHRTTRNLSANTIRSEVRRQARENEAMAMQDRPDIHPDSSWEDIAPQLDAALAELSDVDRDAVILRYFENQSAREIACVLGITVEAAQKRVNRAVDRLRASLAKRGVTAGAAGLAATISSHAVQAAPTSLAGFISSSAIRSASTSAAQTITMTSLQKTLLPLTIMALAGAWLHQHREASRLHEEILALRAPAERLTARNADRPTATTRKGNDDQSAADGEFMVAAGVWDGEWHGAINDDDEFTSFDHFGRPTTDAVERLGLTDEEVATLTAAVARIREEASEDFLTRSKRMGSGPGDGGTYLYSYHVTARPDRGRHFFDAFMKSFEPVLGHDRAATLRSGLEEDNFLGGMGKYELELTFTRGARGGMSVDCVSRNPENGKVVRTLQSSMDSFEESFGKVFQFPETH